MLSPDTDVYHIGVPIIADTDLECVVRLSSFNSTEHQFLDLQALVDAFRNDPSLGGVDTALLPSVMQMVYICTGCDFISFFNGFGKATFMATLFEYAAFICSNRHQTPGILSDMDPDSTGFLSFIRLIGCSYYRKHKNVFLLSFPTPMTLFHSLDKANHDSNTHHSAWLDLMREKIWIKIKYEEEMLPSFDALHRHWRRSCWVCNVWRQATSNRIIYPPLQTYGWKQQEPDTLSIDWDSEHNIHDIRARVSLLKKGCGSKTGCQTSRCKCKKAGHHCGPGCKCQGCVNLPTQSESSISLDMPSSSDYSDVDTDQEVDQIMEDVFGNFPGLDMDYGSDADEATQGSSDMYMDC